MHKWLAVVAVASLVVLGPPVEAQMAHRLKGSLRGTAGAPLAGASIRADNVAGFRGEQFVGAKEHTTTTSATGEWNITASKPVCGCFHPLRPMPFQPPS